MDFFQLVIWTPEEIMAFPLLIDSKIDPEWFWSKVNTSSSRYVPSSRWIVDDSCLYYSIACLARFKVLKAFSRDVPEFVSFPLFEI